MKERKTIEGQVEDQFCGPASLAHAALEQGIKVGQRRVAYYMGSEEVIQKGSSHAMMIEGAYRIGLNVHASTYFSLDDLKWYLDRGNSVIVNWMSGPDDKEDGHYSCLVDVTDEEVVINDPEVRNSTTLGLRSFSREGFETFWYDVDDRDGGRINRWAMVVCRNHFANGSREDL